VNKRITQSVVIGGGSWGTTIALGLINNNKNTILITSSSKNNQNEKFSKLQISERYDEIIPKCDLIIFAVPSHGLRKSVAKISPYISPHTLVLSATKGLENSTNKISTTVISEELINLIPKKQIGVMSGPNLAKEIQENKIALTTIAYPEIYNAKIVQNYFSSKIFRPYTSTDLIGVQYGGSLKNIIAIASGFLDQSNYGDNSKSSLLVRGLNEMKILGVSQGAKEETFYGLSGIGDLITTCYSNLSRNYQFGVLISDGFSVNQAKAKIVQTIEGIDTARSAYNLGKKNNLELPIIYSIYKVIHKNSSPEEVISKLMSRTLKEESP
tara:strand:- start:6951 stop:7928 length:978 start_codon:yes stop_codon:yes gene_type:complete